MMIYHNALYFVFIHLTKKKIEGRTSGAFPVFFFLALHEWMCFCYFLYGIVPVYRSYIYTKLRKVFRLCMFLILPSKNWLDLQSPTKSLVEKETSLEG